MRHNLRPHGRLTLGLVHGEISAINACTAKFVEQGMTPTLVLGALISLSGSVSVLIESQGNICCVGRVVLIHKRRVVSYGVKTHSQRYNSNRTNISETSVPALFDGPDSKVTMHSSAKDWPNLGRADTTTCRIYLWNHYPA